MRATVPIAIIATTTLALCSCSPGSRVSHTELVDLLEIRRWVVPMSKDKRYEWTFDLRDYRPYTVIVRGHDDWMDRTRHAQIVFMPNGADSVYRFWLRQFNGGSSGETRIDVCDRPEETTKPCDVGQLDLTWFPKPVRIDDGKVYLIGEVSTPENPARRKQIVLSLTKFRLEDMLQDAN